MKNVIIPNDSVSADEVYQVHSETIDPAVFAEEQESVPFDEISDKYYLIPTGNKKGIYKNIVKKDEIISQRVGDVLVIDCLVRNIHGEDWGIVCRWWDLDEKEHEAVILYGDLCTGQSKWFKKLSSGGYKGSFREIAEYLMNINTKKITRKILVNSNGWTEHTYILGSQCLKAPDDQNEYYVSSANNIDYYCSGVSENWERVTELICGNKILEFAYLASFAGIFLQFCNMESFGFSFEGHSSCGKTTALQIACAVWGNRKEHFHQWRATCNGLEDLAANYNHNLLILDEIGQASAQDVNNAVYMLGNGSGKIRADSSGKSLSVRKWNLVFLSSGELGISEKLLEEGISVKAGQEVRYIGISVFAEDVQNLHGLKNAQELIDEIKRLTAENYGFEGRCVIEFVQKYFTGLFEYLPQRIDTFAGMLYSGYDPVVIRVARKFALIASIESFLRYVDLLPQDFSRDAVKFCFDRWLSQYQEKRECRDEIVINTVKQFILKNAEKFYDIASELPFYDNCPGLTDKQGNTVFYWIKSAVLQEVFKKELSEAVKILAEHKLLIKQDKGRHTIKKQVKGSPRQSYYKITLNPDSVQG